MPPPAKPSKGPRPEASISPDDPPIASIALGETEALSDSEGTIRSGKLAGKSMWAAIWMAWSFGLFYLALRRNRLSAAPARASSRSPPQVGTP